MATTASSAGFVSPSVGGRTSSILARFTPAADVTAEQYDETISRLKKLGNWPPEGLEYHVAFRSNGGGDGEPTQGPTRARRQPAGAG